MAELTIHPAANEFPLMDEKRLSELVQDIRANGLREEITLCDGAILDGRNRYRACQEAGVSLRTKQFDGDPWAYVWSLNGERRDLTGGDEQRYLIWKRCHEQSEAWNQTQERIAKAANAKRSKAAKEQHKSSNPRAGEKSGNGAKCPTTKTTKHVSRAEKAASSRTNEGAVKRGDSLSSHAPDLAEQVRKGEIKPTDAHKELRKRKRQAKETGAKQTAKRESWKVTKAQKVLTCQALITDPPYGILDEQWEPSEIELFTREWARRWNDCGADLAAIFFSQRYLWDARQWFDETLTNYTFQQLLVWHYPNNKSPQSRKGFKQTWEPVFLYRRNGCEREIQLHGGKWGEGLNDFDCHVAAVPQSNFNDENAKSHPAQKPVSVMLWLVNALTMPGELICDPFCGSGTTGIAAVRLGRRFHGIETNAEYLELSEQRIAAYGEQL